MFFFNPDSDHLCVFPLYQMSILFYDHKDTLVKTSIRNITLQIYSVYSVDPKSIEQKSSFFMSTKNVEQKYFERFQDLILSLPCVNFFGNMSHQLRNIWLKIDQKVQSLTCEDHEINQIFSWIEDQNDLLMYISDILAIDHLSPKIKDVLMQSLLNQAYLPVVVNSLVVMK